jgi:hypothetical protein
MSETQEVTIAPVIFKKNGDLVQDVDGAKAIVAHYDQKTGHLEFTSIEASRKLIRQITAAIGTVNKGTQSSGLVIKTMGVKGQPRDNPKGNVPPKPRRNAQFGDQTPELVEWYFKYYPQEAYIRYGVFLDASGEPVRKRVKRKITELVDDRSGEHGLENQNDGKGAQVGPKKWENGPIGQVVTQDVLDNQIIARRATHMTFAPQEVVGGFDTGDEEDESGGGSEREEGGDE